VPAGKTRICVSGFRVSLNCGISQKLARAIARAHPGQYESWFYFPGPKLGWEPYRSFINDILKQELSDNQKELHNWHSAPCVWLEQPPAKAGGERVITMLGGGDRFREWVLKNSATFAGSPGVLILASREPAILKDEFFDCVFPGSFLIENSPAWKAAENAEKGESSPPRGERMDNGDEVKPFRASQSSLG